MFKELFQFLMKNKKWWLLPPIVVFVVFAAIVVFSATSPVGPFVYMLF